MEPVEPTPNRTYEQPSRWERLALGGGILFAAAQIAAIAFAAAVVIPTHAPVGAPASEIAAALGRHAILIAIGTYLFALPVPFLLTFLGGLFAVMRRAEGGSGALAAAALGSGIAASVITPLGAVLSGLSAPIAQAGGDPAVVKEIDSITPLAMALSGFPIAVLLGAASVLTLEGRLAPRWIGYAGLALALLSLLSTGTIAFRGLFPTVGLQMLLFPLWVLALTVSLLRSRGPAKQTVPEASVA